MTRTFVIGLMLLSLAAPAFSRNTRSEPLNTENVVVSLEPKPSRTIVAFPVSWIVRLTNTANTPAAVGTVVELGTVNPGGQVEFSVWTSKIGGDTDAVITLAPNETRSFAITPASVGTEGRFLRPDALSQVGDHLFVVRIVKDEYDRDGAVVSSQAQLHVEEPRGVDREVIDIVEQKYPEGLKGLQWGRLPASLKIEIDNSFPSSVYSQLIAVFMGPSVLDREIERNRDTAYLPALKLHRAKQLVESGTRAVTNSGPGKGDYDFARAESLLRDLDSEAWNPALSEKVDHLRQTIRSQRVDPQDDLDQDRKKEAQ